MTFTKNNNTIICHYYKEHRNDIFLFVCGRIGDSCVAEDIVQTVFERLLCSTRMITEVTLPALVWHVARNLIYDYWRHHRAVEEFEHRLLRTPYRNSSDADDVETIYSAKEINEILERGIARLTSKQREIYKMNIYNGLKVSEISDALKLNYKSVENLLGAARKSVRQYVGMQMAI